MKKFYMVCVEGGSSPAIKHGTEREAIAEAERLCEKERLNAFVLRSTWVCKPQLVVEIRRIVR